MELNGCSVLIEVDTGAAVWLMAQTTKQKLLTEDIIEKDVHLMINYSVRSAALSL